MKTTLKSIAAMAGISPATVSLALANDPRVAEKTKTHVQEIARKLDYVPSSIGRALQSNRSRLIGYLVKSVTFSFANELLQGIGEVASHAGYGVLVGITGGSAKSEASHLKLFREKGVDGILASNFHPETAKILSVFENSGIPVIACSNVTFDKKVPAIVINNRKGGRMAAEHLISLGHKRIAYCFYPAPIKDRFAGACEVLNKAGCPEPVLCKNADHLASVLHSPKRPTGIICFSDFEAFEAKHAVETTGLSLPEDISIIGFDDLWISELPEFSLTTISQPKREMGTLSMQMLLERMEGKKVKSKFLEPSLVVRNSTAAIRT
jgi:DNA-binding LacI/PurR family transcriptional regulator